MSQMLYAGQSARRSVTFFSDFQQLLRGWSTNLAKFYGPEGPEPYLWPDLWPLKIGHKIFYADCSTICFVILTASSHPNCKSQGSFEKFRKICYTIGTRILKIDSEIAQIIEVKVGTCQWQKNNFYFKGGNFDLKYLSFF